jgi:hypothetical protein
LEGRQPFAYQPLLFSGVVGGERLVCSLVKYHQLKIWLPHSPNGAKSRQDGWFQRLRCGAGYDSRRRPVLFGRCPAGLTQTFSVRLFDEGSGFCGCATDWLGKFGGLERVGWGTASWRGGGFGRENGRFCIALAQDGWRRRSWQSCLPVAEFLSFVGRAGRQRSWGLRVGQSGKAGFEYQSHGRETAVFR